MKTACYHTQQSKRKLTEQKENAESKLSRSYLEALNREILSSNSNNKIKTGNIKKNYDPKKGSIMLNSLNRLKTSHRICGRWSIQRGKRKTTMFPDSLNIDRDVQHTWRNCQLSKRIFLISNCREDITWECNTISIEYHTSCSSICPHIFFIFRIVFMLVYCHYFL